MLRSYVLHYPMTPYAGVFIATVGVCVIAGAVLPNYQASLVWIGFALGAMLFVAVGQILSIGLHTPSFFQVSFLALAIVLEIAGFRYLMPIMRPRGERATLAIVGAHFLVMLPAFGPLIGRAGPRLHAERRRALVHFRLSDGLCLVCRWLSEARIRNGDDCHKPDSSRLISNADVFHHKSNARPDILFWRSSHELL